MSSYEDMTMLDDDCLGGESGLLRDVADIAERALWNPSAVPNCDLQKLAAVVVAHVKRLQSDGKIDRSASCARTPRRL